MVNLLDESFKLSASAATPVDAALRSLSSALDTLGPSWPPPPSPVPFVTPSPAATSPCVASSLRRRCDQFLERRFAPETGIRSGAPPAAAAQDSVQRSRAGAASHGARPALSPRAYCVHTATQRSRARYGKTEVIGYALAYNCTCTSKNKTCQTSPLTRATTQHKNMQREDGVGDAGFFDERGGCALQGRIRLRSNARVTSRYGGDAPLMSARVRVGFTREETFISQTW